MLQRLYVHNFRCLENFELKATAMPSALLIGKNGAGKSTVAATLEIFQNIGRGINRVGQLAQSKDFSSGRSDVPMRFEIEVTLGNVEYHYILALELPENFKELRVLEEQLLVAGEAVFSRKSAQVTVPKSAQAKNEAQFSFDWHLVALPVIQERSETDPLHIFKTWLARMIILAPIPSLITGNSSGETLEPRRDGSNLGEWLSGLLGRYPAAYTTIANHLREVMPDISEFRNDPTGKDAKSMNVHFSTSSIANLIVNFDDLSDGEKCFFLCAVVLAANKAYGPLFCFWDEPDNYLSISEVGHFVLALRRSFKNDGQIIITSHNEAAIRKFSGENTWVLDRKSHLEPTLIKLLEEIPVNGDLIRALTCGDITL
jgi:predicted ATPase